VDALAKAHHQRGALGYNKRTTTPTAKNRAHSTSSRSFLLSCSADDLNYGMNQKLMTEDDELKAGMARLHLTSQNSQRVFRCIRKVGFLNKPTTPSP
jgi:hypothetical protein